MATRGVAAEEPQEAVEPFEEQEPFLYNSHRYYGYLSGVGAGKTAVGVMRDALNMEVWNPGHMGAIVAPTTQMIKNAILPIMRDFGLMDRWEYNSPQSEEPGIVSPNGSRAVILSADNDRQIERLASLNLAWFHVDESRDVPERARQILIQRLRKGDYTNGYFTSTPRGHNHDYDFFVGDHAPEEHMHGQATVYECDDRLAITNVPTDANPHLDRDDVQAIRDAHPSGVLQQEVEGSFIEVGAGVFSRDMLTFRRPDEIPDRPLRTVIAVDPAATVDAQRAEAQDSDFWACAVVQAQPQEDKIYVTETKRRRGMTLAQGCEWIASIANQARGAHVVAEANQAQRWLIEELKEYGVHADAVTSTRNKEQRILDLSIPLENQTVEFVNWNADDPNKGHPYQELESELLSFPESSHDDLVDALHRSVDCAPVSLGVNMMGADPWERGDDE
jgi:predicted phage terminase large subunit-like protein